MSVWIAIIAFVAFAIGFVSTAEWFGGGLSQKWRERARRQVEAAAGPGDDWDDRNPPTTLNYNYIDWLERQLEVGKYDPDRIAIEREVELERQELTTVTSAVDEPPFPGEAKPVDDSWADERVGDAVYGPRTADAIRSYSRGGLRRTMIDSDGNRTEIRSFGN